MPTTLPVKHTNLFNIAHIGWEVVGGGMATPVVSALMKEEVRLRYGAANKRTHLTASQLKQPQSGQVLSSVSFLILKKHLLVLYSVFSNHKSNS